MSDEQKALVEIYKTYNFAKEEFINRNFTTNRYYLSLSLVLMVAALLVYTLTPSIFVMSVIGGVGIVTTTLWLLNVDAYQSLIKIKYAKVLERIEDQLPAKPFQDEFKAAQDAKAGRKKIFVFTDMAFANLQKGFVFMILLIFVVMFAYSVAKSFAIETDGFNNAPTVNTVDLSKIDQ